MLCFFFAQFLLPANTGCFLHCKLPSVIFLPIERLLIAPMALLNALFELRVPFNYPLLPFCSSTIILIWCRDFDCLDESMKLSQINHFPPLHHLLEVLSQLIEAWLVGCFFCCCCWPLRCFFSRLRARGGPLARSNNRQPSRTQFPPDFFSSGLSGLSMS